MGEFVNRGVAMGFAAGVITALIARRYPLTRKHPNLVGFATAGTVDAVSRDYRRPSIYSKLLRLNTPLGHKSQSILFSIRTGLSESDLVYAAEKVPVQPEAVPESGESSAWWDAPVEEEPPTESPSHDQYPYSVVKVPATVGGSKTWDDIRRENRSDKKPS